jgi:uncharacterized delta-60 repeat protein
VTPCPLRALLAISLCGALLTTVAGAAPGDLDASFSGNGWLRTFELRGGSAPYRPQGAQDVAIQPDGKIVAVGNMDGGSSYSAFGAFRYTPAGELDRTFGNGGWVATEIGTFESASAVALQRDGKVVLAGEADCGTVLCFGLVRYRSNGDLDPSFGEGGIVRTVFPGRCGCYFLAVDVQPDGRIVAAGRVFNRYGQIFGLARYLPDGRLDRSFSGDGLATIAFGNSYEGAEALVLQPKGKILIAGGGGRYYDFAVARFRRDGRLDRTFSRDGRMMVSFGRERWDAVHGLALQRDGRIVAVGSSRAGQIGPARIAVARITPKGSLDRRFGSRGRVLTNPVPAGGFAKAVLVLADGRIVVAGLGYELRDEIGSDWVLARYTPAGRLDRSFGGDGIVVNSFGTGADWAGALGRQGDGKIVAAGEVYRDQAVARYLSR